MMKERTNPKSVAPRKVKGTVLFTVVCVMLILIVFLMGALALAATANQRAMNTYSTVQTQATARAGVDAVISAMQNNEEIARAAAGIENSAGKQKVQIGEITFGYMDSVTADDGTVSREQVPISSIGRITDSYIEYAGTKWELDKEGNLVEKTVIKVTATAVQGTAESTYTAYILKNANTASSHDGENQGFISTGSAVSCNHTNVYGGAYIGFDGIFKDATLWETKKNAKQLGKFEATDSNVLYETDFMVNGTFVNDTGSPVHLVLKSPKSGMIVWGDCELNHEIFLETANCYTAAYTDSANIMYKDIPFLYVEKDITFKGPDQVIAPINDTEKIPFHVFCGSIQDSYGNSHGSRIMADVFCYDTAKTSTLLHGNTTKLYDWGTAKVKNLDGTTKPVIGGSYYTKGSLKTDGNVQIAGDLVVEGNLEIASGSLTVGGDVKVRGTVTATGELKIGKNGFFGDSAALTNGNVKLDGAAATIPMIPDPDYELKSATNRYYTEWDAVSNVYWPHWKVMMTSTVEGVTSAPVETGMDAGNGPTPSTVWVGGTEMTYPYETTGDVWVHKTTHAVSTTQPKIVDPSYTPPAGTFTKAALDPSMVIFPKEYEKNVILGKVNPDGSTATTEDYKIIKTVPEILSATTDPYATVYAPTTAGSTINISTLSTGPNHITNSCTLTGSRSDGCGIVIDAPAAGTELWITLDNFSLSGSYFFVDDTNGGTGDVNIFIKNDVQFHGQSNRINDVTLHDGSKLTGTAPQAFTYLTCASVIKAMCDTNADHIYQVYTDPSLALTAADVPAGKTLYDMPKPHLNVYSGENTTNTDAVSKLTMGNANALTAHIKAPYMDFEQSSTGSLIPPCTLYYNGFDCKGNSTITQLGCYGCMICHEFSAGNNWLMMFDGEAGSSTPAPIWDDALYTNWRIIGYDNF